MAKATGGTITTEGLYTVHTFTSGGTFTPTENIDVDSLIVAGGGAGGYKIGGGGGAGGVLEETSQALTVQGYTVVVGNGGVSATDESSASGNGDDSSFNSNIATGGGGGGTGDGNPESTMSGQDGGSGGGSSYAGTTYWGNGTVGQGNDGAEGFGSFAGGGGGGAGAVGLEGVDGDTGGAGGDGIQNSYSGSSVYYGGGGGGGVLNSSDTAGLGGQGGGGDANNNGVGVAGTANTGGGGGAGSDNQQGGAGGTGIVIIRYFTADAVAINETTTLDDNWDVHIDALATGGDITIDGDYTVHTFNENGTFTPSQTLDVDYLIVAGGGSAGAQDYTSGGGGGGIEENTEHEVTAQGYSIVIGAGGSTGADGSDSSFDGIVADGGGAGKNLDGGVGNNGGSGGGGSGKTSAGTNAGGTATETIGNDGGSGTFTSTNVFPTGGGGGGSTVGDNGSGSQSGNGGDGHQSSINGTPTYYSGGGGGGGYDPSGTSAGNGGQGGGGNGNSTSGGAGTSGTVNTGGGGGGGAGGNGLGASGGTGIVIIRYLTSGGGVNIAETVTLDDAWSILTNQFEAGINETVTLNDTWDILLSTIYATLTDTVTLDDAWSILESVVNVTLTDTTTLNDDWSIATTELVNYASQILHYNPLIFVTDTNPVKLVSVDISTPEIPVKSVYTLTGYSGASDIALNETNEYFYITVAGAKVLKIEKADLSNVTEIDTIDTDELVNIDTLDDSFLTFASTDYATGEIIKIDEREIKKFNSDIRWVALKTKIMQMRLNTILAKLFNADLRYVVNMETVLTTDIRWLKTVYADINNDPIDYTDIQILINGVDMVPLNDVDMETVQIVHAVDEKSEASFRLSRRHDKLNYTNTGASSQITNNNILKIIIDGHIEFNGKISSINVESETETAFVTAKMDFPRGTRKTISIPMSSVDENINLYHCMVNSTTIDNPYVDPNDENPEYYKGIKIDLGNHIEQVVDVGRLIEVVTDGQGYYATQLEEGEFDILPGYTYFWRINFINFLTGDKREGIATYIGTSLGSLSTDTYKITAVSPFWQKVRDNIEIEMGEWTIGEAPFKEISVKNGEKVVKGRYEDQTGGLYWVKDEGYNYVLYAIAVAKLEYDKLKNINNTVLPIVNSSIDVTLDAYYYYGVKLLTRINVTNTTTSNIYKNNNGFPVGVKGITISFNTDSHMMVTLQCDNKKSLLELEELDSQYPDEESDEFLFPSTEKLQTKKYDLASTTDGSFFNFPDLPTDDVFQSIRDTITQIFDTGETVAEKIKKARDTIWGE